MIYFLDSMSDSLQGKFIKNVLDNGKKDDKNNANSLSKTNEFKNK